MGIKKSKKKLPELRKSILASINRAMKLHPDVTNISITITPNSRSTFGELSVIINSELELDSFIKTLRIELCSSLRSFSKKKKYDVITDNKIITIMPQ